MSTKRKYRRPLILQLDVVGCLFAVHRFEPAFNRTGEQQLHQTFVAPPLLSFQPVFAAVDAFDLELLARLDAIALPDFGRENNLAFCGNCGFHVGKIMSYLLKVNWILDAFFRDPTPGTRVFPSTPDRRPSVFRIADFDSDKATKYGK
jgi:hypothetical protein